MHGFKIHSETGFPYAFLDRARGFILRSGSESHLGAGSEINFETGLQDLFWDRASGAGLWSSFWGWAPGFASSLGAGPRGSLWGRVGPGLKVNLGAQLQSESWTLASN